MENASQFSLSGLPCRSGLASLPNHVSQFLKINLSLSLHTHKHTHHFHSMKYIDDIYSWYIYRWYILMPLPLSWKAHTWVSPRVLGRVSETHGAFSSWPMMTSRVSSWVPQSSPTEPDLISLELWEIIYSYFKPLSFELNNSPIQPSKTFSYQK